MLKTKLALGIALAFAGTVAIAHPWGMGYGRGGYMMGGGPGGEACEAQMHERHEARVQAADTDGDGAISKAEAEKVLPGLAGKFEAVDTDKDGKVTVSELDAARAAGVLGGPGYGRGMGPGYGRVTGPGADPETRQALRHERHEARVKAADTDGDGAISKAEAEKSLPRLATRFEAVDTDHDGRLTVAELDAAAPIGKSGAPGYGRGMGPGYGGGPCWQKPAPPAREK